MEFSVCLRELKQGLRINLEGWDGEGDGREVPEGGDTCIPMARLRANPVCNFICYQGDITRENLVKAVKAGHVMPAFNVDSAAVSLGEYLPGDTVPAEALKAGLKCAFTAEGDLTELRLWGGDKILSAETLPAGTHSVERVFDLTEYKDVPYFHLELRGKKSHLISNPFFVK